LIRKLKFSLPIALLRKYPKYRFGGVTHVA